MSALSLVAPVAPSAQTCFVQNTSLVCAGAVWGVERRKLWCKPVSQAYLHLGGGPWQHPAGVAQASACLPLFSAHHQPAGQRPGQHQQGHARMPASRQSTRSGHLGLPHNLQWICASKQHCDSFSWSYTSCALSPSSLAWQSDQT